MFNLRYQSSRLFNILTAVILCVLCVLLNVLTRINFHKLELPKDKPEFSATGIEASLYESSGLLLYDVVAESGIEFPDSDKISLKKITVNAYNESNSALNQKLTSDDGWIDTQSAQAFLGENVKIVSYNPDPNQVIYVYTKDVTINSITKKATTSSPIRATQGKSVLTGNGVSLDYDKQFLIIESNVKVIYVTH